MEVLRNFLVQEKTKQELVNELESTAGKKNVYTVDQVKAEWRKYMENCSMRTHGITPQPVKR